MYESSREGLQTKKPTK